MWLSGHHLYLFLGEDDDVFICGTPPRIFLDKNKAGQCNLRNNALVRARSEFDRSRPKAVPTKSYIKISKIKSQTVATPTSNQNIDGISKGSSSLLNHDKTLVLESEKGKWMVKSFYRSRFNHQNYSLIIKVIFLTAANGTVEPKTEHGSSDVLDIAPNNNSEVPTPIIPTTVVENGVGVESEA